MNNKAMRNAIAAALLLLPTAAMAGTYYAPVHVAPIIHLAPVIHVAPVVHVAPVIHANPGVHVHSHHKLVPVVVYSTSQNPKKCVDQKSDSRGCAKK